MPVRLPLKALSQRLSAHLRTPTSPVMKANKPDDFSKKTLKMPLSM